MNNTVFKINEEYCKGCGLCVFICPKKILKLSLDTTNSKGYTPVKITDVNQCIGCLSCAMMCPDTVIRIEKNDGKEGCFYDEGINERK